MEDNSFNSNLNEHLSKFNRCAEQFNKEREDLYKHVLQILKTPESDPVEKLMANQIRTMMNSVYGSSSFSHSLFPETLAYRNIKVVMSPHGYGKTKYLIEEAIAMSEYGKILYISHDNTTERLKEMVYKNNIHDSGHYENICICYYGGIHNEEDKTAWLVNNIEKAIEKYNFSYLIIDGFDAYFKNMHEIQGILNELYIKFNRLIEIVVTVQTPENVPVNDCTKYVKAVPSIVEIKKDRIEKPNGDIYGTFEVIKNCGISNTETSMSELYHYKGNFLLKRAI